MAGLLKFLGWFILGIVYLNLLANSPGFAITLGVCTIGYILLSKQQKVKAAKIAEERRQKAIILAQKQEEDAAERRRQEALAPLREAEEQRKQAIVLERQRKDLAERRQKAIILARQREDLYEYDPSIQESDKRSTKNMWEDPIKWAEAIDARYGVAKKHVLDAELVLNDDIEQLDRYRRQLQAELIPKYEAAIRPFIEDLQLRDEDIPTPRELKIAIDFVYPSNLLPKVIHKDLMDLGQAAGQNIARSLQGKNVMKLQQGEVIVIAITVAFHGIHYLYTLSEQRKKLEQVQADVDLLCEQISGAIRTYGRSSEEIKHLKSVHQVAINYMGRYLDVTLELSTQGKTFADLQESEQKAIETCYRGGQSLKQIMKQDVIKPIENTN
jgi:hypothetical protein